MTTWQALLAALDPAHLDAAKREAIARIVLTVEANTKKATPVRTGNLRRSITGVVEAVDRGRVGTNVVYARSVHDRRPFLTDGLAASSGAIDDALAQIGARLFEELS